MQTIDKQNAESATGCCENPAGLGQAYTGPINIKGRVSGGGKKIKLVADIQDYLRAGGEIAYPNAGAGSYDEAFKTMGFTDCEIFDSTSSAGCWSFAVCDDTTWYVAYQEHRYPFQGYAYSVDFDHGFESKDDCFKFMGCC
jgi:hypothetical protein